jgi:hypothetical protein
MTVNNFTTGRDVSVQINTSYGPLIIPSTAVLSFNADPEVTKLKSKGIDGTPRHAVIPDGWKGSITLDRLDHALDDFWGRFEADYFANVATGVGTIIERIQEQDGTISTWRYDGVVITLEKAGDWAADKKVEQTFTFEAAHKIKVT